MVGAPRPVAYNLSDLSRIPYTGKNVITDWVGQISRSRSILHDSTSGEEVVSGLQVDVWLSNRPCGKM
jgi:hypothetical protein